jgi:undecaprenyl-diphosphatase
MARAEERTEWRFACLIVASLLFGATALAVAVGLADNIDTVTRAAINRWASPQLTLLAHGLSFIGSVAFLVTLTVVTAGGLWIGGRPRAALMLTLVFASALVLNNVVKLSFARARPEAFFGIVPESYSFASGHALFAACYYGVVAGLIAAHVPKDWHRAAVWVIACSIIAGVGLSRIYLGVHYLTDVIAGFALAALIVCVVRSVVTEQR